MPQSPPSATTRRVAPGRSPSSMTPKPHSTASGRTHPETLPPSIARSLSSFFTPRRPDCPLEGHGGRGHDGLPCHPQGGASRGRQRARRWTQPGGCVRPRLLRASRRATPAAPLANRRARPRARQGRSGAGEGCRRSEHAGLGQRSEMPPDAVYRWYARGSYCPQLSGLATSAASGNYRSLAAICSSTRRCTFRISFARAALASAHENDVARPPRGTHSESRYRRKRSARWRRSRTG